MQLSNPHEDMQGVAAASCPPWARGGSVPLCKVFADTYPDAEIILMGVEEPLILMHAPNESVDPAELATMALTEALFLQNYAASH